MSIPRPPCRRLASRWWRRRSALRLRLLATGALAGAALTLGLVPASAGAAPAQTGAAASPGGTGQPVPADMLAPLAAVDGAQGGHFVSPGGHVFDLRGFDYQPLVLTKVSGRTRSYSNVTFIRADFHPAEIAAMLKSWRQEGYDAVRVFLNPGQIGVATGRGLSANYLADVADFVKAAQLYGVRTLVTVGELPARGGYDPPQARAYGRANEDYLDPAFLAAETRYLSDLVADLRADGAPLVDVLWELKGEQDWDNDAAPLSWRSGKVGTADGKTYDMAVASSRVAMENDNLAFWANDLTATLHRLVSGSLVGVGVYPPSVKRAKWTVRPGALFTPATKSDFVDIHVYPNLGPELAQIESFDAAGTEKPVIMGEFGATRSVPLAAAAKSLVTWQEESCRIGGMSISGWLLWTWNSSVDTEFWDALDGGGLLEQALAPVARPNPCAA